ncbi:MAG: molybdopterin-synthase adenylyltransferase MoeB, partial [Gammaproteobacteria bacterium]
MSLKESTLALLRQKIPEVTPTEAHTMHRSGSVLIDIRTPEETSLGIPQGAVMLTRDRLELNIEDHAPEPIGPGQVEVKL